MQILISAGEASGEMYGAQLIEALRLRHSSLTFFGAGGERMRAAGCNIIVDAKDLAVVGITEIVSHLPKILGLFDKLIQAADDRHPALAIVIDSPAFNWRVARQMHKRGIPVVYYVCPQFWAWRQGRVKLLRNYVDKALVIFPFEEKFYRDRGVDATFVGHPLADLPMPSITREAYAAQPGTAPPQGQRAQLGPAKPDPAMPDPAKLDPSKPWITLMPGSRRKEVRMNLPTILEAAAQLGPSYQFLLPVARTLDVSFFEKLIADMRPVNLPNIHLVPDALPALRHSRAAIVASGTATVEAALMETPFVMVYRVSPLTYALGKPRVKVPYYAMVNLVSGEKVVPELVQNDFTAQNILAELSKIIPDGPKRDEMIQRLQSVRKKLRKPDAIAIQDRGATATFAADRAAEIILRMLR